MELILAFAVVYALFSIIIGVIEMLIGIAIMVGIGWGVGWLYQYALSARATSSPPLRSTSRTTIPNRS